MKNKKGFTLVELLVVIVILGGLILLIMPTVLNAMESSSKNIFAQEVINFSGKVQSSYEINKGEHGAIAPLCYFIDNLKDGDTYQGCMKINSDSGKVEEIHVYNNEFKFQTGVDNLSTDPTPPANTEIVYASLVQQKGKVVGKLRTGENAADDQDAIRTNCPVAACQDAIVPFDGQSVVPVPEVTP